MSKKRRIKHLGHKVHVDEKGQMYKEIGNARIYLNSEAVKEIEARKKK